MASLPQSSWDMDDIKIISNSVGYHINNSKFPKSSDFMCTACATRKLILRTSYLEIKVEPLQFLERIQGEICVQFIHSSDHIGTSWY